METTNIPTPVLELRQDGIVAIPIERYEELIAAETRLSILFDLRRKRILDFTDYAYREDNDIIISHKLAEVWKERESLEKENNASLTQKETDA